VGSFASRSMTIARSHGGNVIGLPSPHRATRQKVGTTRALPGAVSGLMLLRVSSP